LNECLFCKIVNKEIPANIIWEDDEFVAFSDIAPISPIHNLVIPKKHFKDLAELTLTDPALSARLNKSLIELAQELNLDTGYRIIFNTGEIGGQSVFHVHGHLLAGRQMSWPAG
jgi:histidine triad (HIT) family protein